MSFPRAFGPYTLLARVNSGGMAEVFRAREKKHGHVVALKKILPHIAEDDEFIAMFEDEARIVSRLEHPHIARMLDFGRVDGSYYIAFEYVHGKDLRAVFERSIQNGTSIPLPFLLYAFSRIGEGLSYAHARRDENGLPSSIVHRDISPQNIIVSTTGDIKLIDFGIAKAQGKATRTQVGSIKGSFGYMSPEQACGGTVTAQADVFGMGVCLWELLTQRRLFDGENEFVILQKIRDAANIWPPSSERPDVPPELDRVVMRALAFDSEQRYRSARELYRELHGVGIAKRQLAAREEVASYMRHLFPELTDLPQEPAPGASASVAPSGEPLRGKSLAPSGEPLGSGHVPQSQRIGWQDAPAAEARSGTMSAPVRAAGGVTASSRESATMSVDDKDDDETIQGRLPPKDAVGGFKFESPWEPYDGRPASVPPLGTRPVTARRDAPRPPAPPEVPRVVKGGEPFLPVVTSAPPVIMNGPGLGPIGKRTLLGVHAPIPPGGGELTSSDLTPVAVPFSASTPLTNASYPASAYAPPQRPAPYGQPGGTLPLDWDDEHEASNILDNTDSGRISAPTPLDRDGRRSANPRITPPPPPPAPPPTTQRGGFRNTPPPSNAFASGPVSSPRGSGAVPVTSGYLASPPEPRLTPPPRRYEQTARSSTPFSQPLPMGGPPSSRPPPSSGFPRRATPVPAPVSNSMPHAYGAPHAPSFPPGKGLPPGSRNEATALVRPPPNRIGIFIALALALLVVSASALVVMLIPRTGKVAVRVTDAKGIMYNRVEIFLDGKKQCDTSPCLIEGVSSGTHNVKVLGEGGAVGERPFVTEARKEVPVDVVLAAGTARPSTGLRVAGSQPGMKLYVDGREIGPLPQDVKDLPPGDHKIRIVGNERYEPLERIVTLAKDEMQDLGTVPLKVLRGKVTITLGTPGAKVYLVSGPDRRDLPTFPISVDIDTSNKTWNLEASRFGFADYRQPISFVDGQAEKTFNVQLEPKVPLPQFAAANPRVNAPVAPAPPPPSSPPKSEGPTMLTDRNAAAASASADGEAFLNINSIPASSVVLDGKPIGSTPKVRISVPPGSHTVVFVNAEQGLRKSVQVSVAAGDTKPVIGKLRE